MENSILRKQLYIYGYYYIHILLDKYTDFYIYYNILKVQILKSK